MEAWNALFLIIITTGVSCKNEGDISQQINVCLSLNGNDTDVMKLPASTHAKCLRQFLWNAENVKWENFNITQKDKDFVNFLFDSIIKGTIDGAKTKIHGGFFPKTGFRIRKEIRRLSDKERKAFQNVIIKMKASGQYDTFANIHTGQVVALAHGGPNFFGWHRIFLSLIEEAMRRIDPTVSLPYFDSTMDTDMEDPRKSIIWSAEFLGNGDGDVVTGPFANWMTPFGRLTRSLGERGGRLIDKKDIAIITKMCRTNDISYPTAQEVANLDHIHGRPHMWIGGQMFDLNSVAHDPSFLLHHCFIDYMWELFRKHQAKVCGVNPATDYPSTVPDQLPESTMVGLTQYKNIDGYSHVWTKYWYKYETSPTCSKLIPACGSPYLKCDVKRSRCVSIEAPTSSTQQTINQIMPEDNLAEILAQDIWFG